MSKKRHGKSTNDSRANLKSSDDSCTVKPHEPLRVTLEDLRSAENRGKWWLVGSAWNGDPLAENRENPMRNAAAAEQDNRLLKLARKQGMNTDIRRSIFIVLMSGEVGRALELVLRRC
jgi:nucleolar MIF4G domain-containing protein 1